MSAPNRSSPFQSNLSVLEGLIEEVKHDPSDLSSSDALKRICSCLDNLTQDDTNTNSSITDEVQNLAILLWNTAVARKTGKNIEKNANAKLRHCACLLVFLDKGTSVYPVLLKRQIMMAIKTSRAWLDSDSPLLADTSLNWAMQSLEKFKSFLENEADDSESKSCEMDELEKNMFKMLTYRVESACIQGNMKTAMEALQSAKYLIPNLPKEAPHLCVMCYNLGCVAYKKMQYNESAMWLRESIELGKNEIPVGPETQAKTLRLLATVYIDWDSKQYMQKALNAIGLANAEYCHPVGLYLKLRILLQGGYTDSRIQSALEDIIHHSDLEIETALLTINLLASNTRFDLAFDTCKKLSKKYQASPQAGRILLLHLEMLLERNMCQVAKDTIEDFITAKEFLSMVDIDTKTRLHIVLWKKAASSFESNDFSDSLTWYNYSLSLFSCSDKGNKNLAKLQRNRASCFLALNNLAKAEETIKEATKHDETNSYTYFLTFKVALMKGQDVKAIEAIKKMCEDKVDKPVDSMANDATDKNIANKAIEKEDEVDNSHGLICLAAQLAFEKSNRVVAVKALEALVATSEDPTQVLTAIRCLIRLKVTLMEGSPDKTDDIEAILSYLKTAVSKLTTLSSDASCNSELVTREATWFIKMSWNLALQCTEKSRFVNSFFTLCCKFCSFGEEDTGGMVRQKTCRLMSAASCLQAARETTDKTEKVEFLNLVLSHVDGSHRISQKLKTLVDPEKSAKDSTGVLMVLYEFEALARLGEGHKLMDILDKANALPYQQPKTFETIAVLCMETSVGYKDVALKALNIAFQMHMANDAIDFKKCSKVVHSLVELMLQDSSKNTSTSKDESWSIFQKSLDIINHKAKGDYPEIEVQWLMTKAWNTGIHMYSTGLHIESEKWCGMSMKFLNYLPTMRSNYETHMDNIYTEILSKIQKEQTKVGTEE